MDRFMQIYTVCFFGHRELYDLKRVEERLTPIVRELIQTKPYVVFLVGRNGEFDKFAASVIKKVQKEEDRKNSELVLVLPYIVADIGYYKKYYDSVTVPECVNGVHPKSAITKRNRWMVEQSKLVTVNVERNSGGAYTVMKYAKKLNKKVINLCG